MTIKEQYWIDKLNPEYNILKFAKSSLNYKHLPSSLAKMRGSRPHFRPSDAIISNLIRVNKERHYDSDMLSRMHGTTVYVFDLSYKLISEFSSIKRVMLAYNIRMRYSTFYKYVEGQFTLNGHIFSFNPTLSPNNSNISSTYITPVKARKIYLLNTLTNVSYTCNSLNSAAK